jgi:4-diphosphocytidyl-2-C-methyl-D-erythritol kinase
MFEPFALTARAKVNLALNVLGRRPDGYHDLDSIVAFADVGDELRFSPASQFSISADGPFGAALPAPADNIIARAWEITSGIAGRRGRALPAVAVHLTKTLPVASGIGGGSADAAEALRGFLKIAGIDGIDSEVMAAALTLGADVPVCLVGKACRMQGVGERITPLADFKPVHAVLVNPGIAVSTPDVFGKLGLAKGQAFGEPIADPSDQATWRNDLAAPAIAVSPVIADVIEWLRAMPGVTHAFMSGSGATCVGISDGPLAIGGLRSGWWMAQTVLR